MTTVASGRCTSAPWPVASAIGTKPSDATRAVIRIGRSRTRQPVVIARSRAMPSCRSWLTNVTMTTPFSTATPDRAMKPIAAEIENGMSRNHRPTMPPDSPSGTPLNTSSAYFTLRNIENSSTKIRKNASGTTSSSLSRAAARFW